MEPEEATGGEWGDQEDLAGGSVLTGDVGISPRAAKILAGPLFHCAAPASEPARINRPTDTSLIL